MFFCNGLVLAVLVGMTGMTCMVSGDSVLTPLYGGGGGVFGESLNIGEIRKISWGVSHEFSSVAITSFGTGSYSPGLSIGGSGAIKVMCESIDLTSDFSEYILAVDTYAGPCPSCQSAQDRDRVRGIAFYTNKGNAFECIYSTDATLYRYEAKQDLPADAYLSGFKWKAGSIIDGLSYQFTSDSNVDVCANRYVDPNTDYDLANIRDVRAGFNVLRGTTPSEQRTSTSQATLFHFSYDGEPWLDGELPDQLIDLSTNENCHSSTTENHVYWATSSETLRRQEESSSHGFDQQSTIGVSGGGVTAKTTLRNALVFGNSKTSQTERSKLEQGFTYTYDETSTRNMYAVDVDWECIGDGDWDAVLVNALDQLNNDIHPSDLEILNFFQEFGTHGLAKAAFGQMCTASMFMEGGYQKETYSSFTQTTEKNKVGLWWWTSSSSSTSTDSSIKTQEDSFRYLGSNKYCYGSMINDSPCGFKGSGGSQSQPAIIQWAYKPFWEMLTLPVDAAIKARMKQIFQGIYDAGLQCGINHCSGHGACQPRDDRWDNQFTVAPSDYSVFWNGEVCFCHDNYIGETCNVDTTRYRSVISSSWTGWVNSLDHYFSETSYGSNQVFRGVHSKHYNSREDRYFCFKKENPSDGVLLPRVDYGYQNGWDAVLNFECPSDHSFITAWTSYHDNHREDRRYAFSCSVYKDSFEGSCQWTDYINSFDAEFTYQCPYGYGLNGIISYHNNHHEDRRFKFRCCQILLYALV